MLLFQDLAVVPFLVLVPALAGAEGDLAPRARARRRCKAAAILGVVLLFSASS